MNLGSFLRARGATGSGHEARSGISPRPRTTWVRLVWSRGGAPYEDSIVVAGPSASRVAPRAHAFPSGIDAVAAGRRGHRTTGIVMRLPVRARVALPPGAMRHISGRARSWDAALSLTEDGAPTTAERARPTRRSERRRRQSATRRGMDAAKCTNLPPPIIPSTSVT